jgi:hypothetical protein
MSVYRNGREEIPLESLEQLAGLAAIDGAL